ncbi:MAG: hypothetical protein P1V97_18895 [Planctomycetota bacterium]|nr:hypothetical protein [Planctomycetota bacterium]
MRRLLFLLIVFLCIPALAWAGTRKGTIKLKDGRTLTGDIEEFKDEVVLKKSYGLIRYKRKEISQIIYDEPDPEPKKTDGAKSSAGADQSNGRSFLDFEGRFVLHAPKNWTISKSVHPAIRATLKHKDESKGAFMYVSVKPFEGKYPDPAKDAKAAGRTLNTRVKSELAAVFASQRGAAKPIQQGWLFETPVFYTSYSIGRDPKLQVVEYRFFHQGFEYTLRAGCLASVYLEIESWLVEACESFSFIPPVEVSSKHYLDFVVGYSVNKPGKDWEFDVDVFNDRRPVRIKSTDGASSVSVEVLDGRSPGELIRKEIAAIEKNSSGRSTEVKNGDGSRDGVNATYRVIRGFEKGGRKSKDFYFFSCRRDKKTLLVKAIGPSSEGNADKIRASLEAFFDKIRIFDPAVSKRRLGETNTASNFFGDGIKQLGKRDYQAGVDAFSEAIKRFPNFRRAYLLRADCYEKLKEWELYREDLSKAVELDPSDEALGAKVAKSYYNEAQEVARKKDFKEATKLIKKAFYADKKSKKVKDSLVKINKEYLTFLTRKKEFKDAIKIMKSLASAVRIPETKQLLSDAYFQAATEFNRQRNLRKARDMARKSLKTWKTNTKAKTLLKSVEAALEREQNKK